jgi:hypothetical protein
VPTGSPATPTGPAYGTTSTQTGNFNIGTTWGGACSSSCTAGVDYPATSESVTIANGHTVTLTATQTVVNATINSGGTLSLGSNTLILTGTGGSPLSISGTFTPGTGTIQYTGATVVVAPTTYYDLTTGGTGSYALSSTTTVSHTLSITSGATLSPGSNTLILSGTGTPLSISGTFTAGTGTVQYTGSTATVTATTFKNITLGGTGTYTLPASGWTIDGNLTVTTGATVTKDAGTITFGNSAGTVTVTGNATNNDLGTISIGNSSAAKVVNLGSSIKFTAITITSGATLSLNGANTLTLTGTGTPFVPTGTFTPSTGTVIYSGATATVAGTTYNNLTFTGSGGGGAEERPVNSYIGTNISSGNGGADYNMGIKFTPTANGYIDKLWLRLDTGFNSTVRLYRQSDGAVLATASISSIGSGTWVSSTLGSPVSVTSGTTYIVAARTGTYAYYGNGASSITSGNITLTQTGLVNGLALSMFPITRVVVEVHILLVARLL